MAITASGDELRQTIDGKLTGDGRETQNIQVVLTGGPSSEFFLYDVDGRFFTVQATVEGTQSESFEPSEQDPNEESQLEADTLRMELEALTRENQALKAEVSVLEQKLSDEKSRFREMWRTNCQCLAECDEEITNKDVDIEWLKCQLCSLSAVSHLPAVDTRLDSHETHGRWKTHRPEPVHPAGSRVRRGKAPPVDSFRPW